MMHLVVTHGRSHTLAIPPAMQRPLKEVPRRDQVRVRIADPRRNWGHVLGRIVDDAEAGVPQTLRHHFEAFGVAMFDPFAEPQA
jgi:hypothetical protein